VAKSLLPGIPHFSKATPKPGTPDTKNIFGYGSHSKFFTPAKPVTPKSGVAHLDFSQGVPKTRKGTTTLGKGKFPPPLPKYP
jgi:hypothetical protein